MLQVFVVQIKADIDPRKKSFYSITTGLKAHILLAKQL